MARYSALELGQPGKDKCPDQYRPETATEPSTLVCPGCTRLMLQISKQKVFVQLGVFQQGTGAGQGTVQWQTEEPFIPLVASLGRHFDAVRVRNWKAGSEAEVFISVA